MNRTDETETLLIILKKCFILPLTCFRLIILNLRLNLNLEHLKVLKNAEPLAQRCSFYLAVAFADAWVLRRAVARPCGAKLPRPVSWMLKAQLLKLSVVAPEKKPDLIWTGLKVADLARVTEGVGRVVVSVRVEVLTGWLLLERLSARDIRL